MGIRVGKSNPKPFTADTSFNLNSGKQSQTYTADERKALVDSLMRLPKDKVIPALRSAGLDDEANALEQKMAQKHLDEMRKEKLAEIMALPEDERLAALLDNGFTEEAAAESKRQAEAKLWSAVITLLNKYNVIDINDEQTHSVLESASDPQLNTAERVLFCNNNGLVTLGEAYTSVLDGMTLEELESQLAEEAKKQEEAAAAASQGGEGNGEGTGEGEGTEGTGEGTGEAPAENAETPENNEEAPAEAAEPEKKKPGRPAGSTTKK